MLRDDVVLVAVAGADAGHEGLPDARGAARTQRMALAIPAVEVADHRDARRVRRPDREVGPLDAFHGSRMRSELLVQAQVASLVEEVEILVAEQRHLARQPRRPPSRSRRRAGRGFRGSESSTQPGRLFSS